MRIIRILILAILFTSLFTGSARAGLGDGFRPEPAARPEAAAGTDQLVITFAADAAPAAGAPALQPEAAAARLSAASGVALRYQRQTGGGAAVVKLAETLPAEAALALAERLARQPGVLRAEPDWLLQPAGEVQPAAPPSDLYWGFLWSLMPYQASGGEVFNGGIDAQAAWAITTGDPNLLVAVLDTGIVKTHEDLYNRYQLNGVDLGFDMVADVTIAGDGNGRDPDPSDPGDFCGKPSSWHGTHVAGTIGAIGNNALGVAGINWTSKIVPVRVLGRCGGYASDIADGILWAAGVSVPGAGSNPYANQVKVINLSLGGGYACPSYMQTAVDMARAHGIVLSAAAGNGSVDAAGFMPGSCSGVITVAATTGNGFRADYSNYGSLVEISAPGGEISLGSNNDGGILSTSDSGDQTPTGSDYVFMAGTSMAAPHVSGIVSLMVSANPRLTAEQVLMILQRTASPFASTSVCSPGTQCGAGIAHAGRAVADAAGFYWIEWPTPGGRYGMAFAGDRTAPDEIRVVTLAAVNPRKTAVTIGGVEAVVKTVVTAGGLDYLTVQPAAMPANGVYDLQVTLDGAAHTQPQSVAFGPRLYLPIVNR